MQLGSLLSQRKKVRWVVTVFLFDGAIERLGAEEDASHRVIVFGRDGVELVVVALCAGDVESEKGTRGNIDLVIHDFHAKGIAAGVVTLRSEGQEAGCDQTVFHLLGRFIGSLGQEIAGDLLPDKLIIGFVRVE